MMVLLRKNMMQQQHQQNGPLQPPRNIILSILLAPVLFLSTLLANLNHLSILNSLENIIDAGASKLFNSLLGFNLEFEVHKNGCLLVTHTGNGNPLGNDCAVYLANKGFTVFCGVAHLHEISILRSRVERSERQRLLVPVLLPDATNDELVENVLLSILHHFETLEFAKDRVLIGIVNTANSKLNEMTPLEDVSSADWNRILNHNVIGPFAIISKFLPLLRQSSGRIINVSSFTSLTSSPMNGVFACSKIALENATDTLRNEVYNFGISVSLIQSGALDDLSSTQSQQQQSASPRNRLIPRNQEHKELYAPITETIRQISSTIRTSSSLQKTFTSAVDHALFAPIPKTKYHLGWDTKVTRWIRWAVSDRFLDFVLQGLVKQNSKILENQQRN